MCGGHCCRGGENGLHEVRRNSWAACDVTVKTPSRVTVMPLLSCASLAALFHITAPGCHQAGCEWQVHKLFERCPCSNQAYLQYFRMLNMSLATQWCQFGMPPNMLPCGWDREGAWRGLVLALQLTTVSCWGGTQSLRNHIGPGLAEDNNHFTRYTGRQSSCGGYLQACRLPWGTASFDVLSASSQPSSGQPSERGSLPSSESSFHLGQVATLLQLQQENSRDQATIPVRGRGVPYVAFSARVSLTVMCHYPKSLVCKVSKDGAAPVLRFPANGVNQKQKLLQVVVQIWQMQS